MTRAGRVILLLLLVRWTFLFLAWPMRQDVIGSSFLHLISLPFHEAGHVIFSPLGDLMTALGGSLMQVIVPIACGVAFLTTSPNPFAAAIMAWWMGQNFADVALYIGDARALNLVLLGGRTGAEVEGHDWERILQILGLLHRDRQIAGVVHFLGGALMIGAIVWGTVLTFRKEPEA